MLPQNKVPDNLNFSKDFSRQKMLFPKVPTARHVIFALAHLSQEAAFSQRHDEFHRIQYIELNSPSFLPWSRPKQTSGICRTRDHARFSAFSLLKGVSWRSQQ